MQELLGRISALDPEASTGLRVIACFDELIAHGVGTTALLATAAALAGGVAGYAAEDDGTLLRVAPDGAQLPAAGPGTPRLERRVDAAALVWLERGAPVTTGDELILERLELAVRVRRLLRLSPAERPRPAAALLDDATPPHERAEAMRTLGIAAESSYRVAVTPIVPGTGRSGVFSEVVATAQGPVQATILRAGSEAPLALPSGVGGAVQPDRLPHSLRAALVALRLAAVDEPVVRADEYGGLIDYLANQPEPLRSPDAPGIQELMELEWGPATVASLVRCGSLREAARSLGLHHSTVTNRLESVRRLLGFDPFEGYGRARLTLAWLLWRLAKAPGFE